MDVVYVCRPGHRNEELRYSLRSLVNLPHDRVWIAGGWPPWVAGVELLAVPTRRTKYEATTANLRAALAAEISERFILMNDDIFVMRPLEVLPVLHKGPIREVVRTHSTHSYSRTMRALADWLDRNGHGAEPICYEVHAPMEMDRAGLLEALALPLPDEVRDRHKRSIYGNHWRLGGERTVDFKVGGNDVWSDGWPFISTIDTIFASGAVGRHIRHTFSSPGPYER